MRKFLAVAVLSLVGLVGCDSAANHKEPVAFDQNNISYFQDTRTGLCFAATNSFNGHVGYITSIATVPCDKVKGQLK